MKFSVSSADLQKRLQLAGGASLAQETLLNILVFGIGFGWPLMVLPFLAVTLQRRFTGWLARNHTLVNRVSGALLIFIGLLGFATEIVPNVA